MLNGGWNPEDVPVLMKRTRNEASIVNPKAKVVVANVDLNPKSGKDEVEYGKERRRLREISQESQYGNFRCC